MADQSSGSGSSGPTDPHAWASLQKLVDELRIKELSQCLKALRQKHSGRKPELQQRLLSLVLDNPHPAEAAAAINLIKQAHVALMAEQGRNPQAQVPGGQQSGFGPSVTPHTQPPHVVQQQQQQLSQQSAPTQQQALVYSQVSSPVQGAGYTGSHLGGVMQSPSVRASIPQSNCGTGMQQPLFYQQSIGKRSVAYPTQSSNQRSVQHQVPSEGKWPPAFVGYPVQHQQQQYPAQSQMGYQQFQQPAAPQPRQQAVAPQTFQQNAPLLDHQHTQQHAAVVLHDHTNNHAFSMAPGQSLQAGGSYAPAPLPGGSSAPKVKGKRSNRKRRSSSGSNNSAGSAASGYSADDPGSQLEDLAEGQSPPGKQQHMLPPPSSGIAAHQPGFDELQLPPITDLATNMSGLSNLDDLDRYMEEYMQQHISPEVVPPSPTQPVAPVGVNDRPVRCPCGVDAELNKPVVQCSNSACGVWQHLHCVGSRTCNNQDHTRGGSSKSSNQGSGSNGSDDAALIGIMGLSLSDGCSGFMCELCRAEKADVFTQIRPPLLLMPRLLQHDGKAPQVLPSGESTIIQTLSTIFYIPQQYVIDRVLASQQEDAAPQDGTGSVQQAGAKLPADRNNSQRYDIVVACVKVGDEPSCRYTWPLFPHLEVNRIRVDPQTGRGPQQPANHSTRDKPVSIAQLCRVGPNNITMACADASKYMLFVGIVRQRGMDEVKSMLAPSLPLPAAVERARKLMVSPGAGLTAAAAAKHGAGQQGGALLQPSPGAQGQAVGKEQRLDAYDAYVNDQSLKMHVSEVQEVGKTVCSACLTGPPSICCLLAFLVCWCCGDMRMLAVVWALLMLEQTHKGNLLVPCSPSLQVMCCLLLLC